MRGWREQKEAPCWLRAAHLLGSLEEVSPPACAGVTKDLQGSWVKSIRSGLVGILLLLFFFFFFKRSRDTSHTAELEGDASPTSRGALTPTSLRAGHAPSDVSVIVAFVWGVLIKLNK